MERRSVVDYALARRALLTDVRAGRAAAQDATDAHPYLLRAAQYCGEPTSRPCPLCRASAPLTQVTYAYGHELGETSGRTVPTRELDEFARRYRDLSVWVVEVCRGCGWNHAVTSFVIGTGPRRRPARALAGRQGSVADPVAGPAGADLRS